MSLLNNTKAEELSIVTEKRMTRSSKRAAVSVESLPEIVSRKKIKKSTVGPPKTTIDSKKRPYIESKTVSKTPSGKATKAPPIEPWEAAHPNTDPTARGGKKGKVAQGRGRDNTETENGSTDTGNGTNDTGKVTISTGRGKGVRGRGSGTTGRGKGVRGRGTGNMGKGIRGRGNRTRERPAQRGKGPQFLWSEEPPTAAQLAELGREEGCQYVLSSKSRSGKGYKGNSRSWK